MKIWTCTSCGATERHVTIPDGCTVCGGQMETQDDRRIAGFCEGTTPYRQHSQIEPWAVEAIKGFEDEMSAADGDIAALIRLWQSGVPLDEKQQALIDDALAGNRVELLARVYEQAA